MKHYKEGGKEMRNKRSNEIRTPRLGAKVGDRVMRGTEPVALVKSGETRDTISLGEMAEALYGPGTQCLVIPPAPEKRKAV